jgi:hypothetical protein
LTSKWRVAFILVEIVVFATKQFGEPSSVGKFRFSSFGGLAQSLKDQGQFFCPFLKFGQAIIDAIFVQKISKFW